METNFVSPPVIVKIVKALLKSRTIEELRAANQVFGLFLKFYILQNT